MKEKEIIEKIFDEYNKEFNLILLDVCKDVQNSVKSSLKCNDVDANMHVVSIVLECLHTALVRVLSYLPNEDIDRAVSFLLESIHCNAKDKRKCWIN